MEISITELVERVTRLEEKCKSLDRLEADMDQLTERVNKVVFRLGWIVGVIAAAGVILGNIIWAAINGG